MVVRLRSKHTTQFVHLSRIIVYSWDQDTIVVKEASGEKKSRFDTFLMVYFVVVVVIFTPFHSIDNRFK